MSILKNSILAGSLVAAALVMATPALAREPHRRNDDTAAVAVGTGISGIATGPIAALGHSDRNRDDRYQDERLSNGNGYSDNRSDHRHARDQWQRQAGERYRYDHDYYGRRGY